MPLKHILFTILFSSKAYAFCPTAPTSNIFHRPFVHFSTLSEETTTTSVKSDAEESMERALSSIKKKLLAIQTSRPNPSLLDPVRLKYYGVLTPLNQLATISVLPGRLITVEPYDKSILNNIDKAIAESDLELNSSNDGSIVRLTIPELTEEKRKGFLKKCKSLAEDGKVSIRNIRRNANDSIKSLESEIGKDEAKNDMDEIQKLTDKFIKEVEEMIQKKETELMKV